MKQFRIEFHVRQEQLPTIVGLLTGEVTHFAIQEVENGRSRGPSTTIHRKSMEPGDTRSGRLIIQALRERGGEATFDELRAVLAASGYSPKSVSPTASKLVKAGHVTRLLLSGGHGVRLTGR